ncbi:MAG: hypothetical protein WCL50_17930 [Spirochaetota bacterium]
MQRVVAGWLAALLAPWILSVLLGRLGFNRFCDRTGLSKFLLTGNIPHKPSRFFGIIAHWLIMFQVLIPAAGSLDIHQRPALVVGTGGLMPGALA